MELLDWIATIWLLLSLPFGMFWGMFCEAGRGEDES
jgi:hypothetical protein